MEEAFPSSWNMDLPNGENVVCRLATSADRQLVLNMGGVYDGFDYLPDLFHQFAHNSDAYLVCMEISGELVAFRILLVLEQGRSVLGIAARTHPRHQSKNLMTRITWDAVRRLKRKYANLSTFVFTALLSPGMVNLAKKNNRLTQRSKWKWMILGGSLTSVKKLSQARNSRQAVVHLANQGPAAGMPVGDAAFAKLGDSPLLGTACWIPYPVHNQTNLMLLSKLYDMFYTVEKGEISSLSIGSLARRMDSKFIYMLSIVGRQNMEMALLLCHLAKAIQQLTKVVGNAEDIFIHFHFPSFIDENQLLDGIHRDFTLSQIRPNLGIPYKVLEVGLFEENVDEIIENAKKS